MSAVSDTPAEFRTKATLFRTPVQACLPDDNQADVATTSAAPDSGSTPVFDARQVAACTHTRWSCHANL